jgi:spore germination cell wall hydrolase CwlJ-like protein
MDPTLKLIQDVSFLALVLWRECRGEPHLGKIAVAHSIMNRVKRPAWWGDSVLAVVTKKWQYSSMTDPKDRQLVMWPADGDKQWQDCLSIAMGVYSGNLDNPAPGADSYYADTIPAPNWAEPKKFVVKIGHHSFFDLDSDHERRT